MVCRWVGNEDTYGMTFDLKTGKKITLDKVCADKTSKVASTLKKKILKEAANLDVRNVTKNKMTYLSLYFL